MYTATGKIDQSFLIKEHMELVRKEAFRMIRKVPSSVELDDLMQAGLEGLVKAAQQFSLERGVEFPTYAYPRIKGAMIDELRKLDWAPRSVRRGERAVVKTIAALSKQLGRHPTEPEIAEKMEMSLESYRTLIADSVGASLISLDETGVDFVEKFSQESVRSPLDILQDSLVQQNIAEGIRLLPEREGFVVAMYYQEDMNLKEIGAVLEVSESRASQILAQGMARLKAYIQTNVMPKKAPKKKDSATAH